MITHKPFCKGEHTQVLPDRHPREGERAACNKYVRVKRDTMECQLALRRFSSTHHNSLWLTNCSNRFSISVPGSTSLQSSLHMTAARPQGACLFELLPTHAHSRRREVLSQQRPNTKQSLFVDPLTLTTCLITCRHQPCDRLFSTKNRKSTSPFLGFLSV